MKPIPFWAVTIKRKGHMVAVTQGGCGVFFDGGDFCCRRIAVPLRKPSRANLNKIADKAVAQYERFMKKMLKEGPNF